MGEGRAQRPAAVDLPDSFAEPTKLAGGSSGNAWFALVPSMPLSFLPSPRTSWHGIRRKGEGPLDHEVYAFFTTEPNNVVMPIHQKGMPVILRTPEEWDVWLRASWSEANALQSPHRMGVLEIVATLTLKYAPRDRGDGTRSASAQRPRKPACSRHS